MLLDLRNTSHFEDIAGVLDTRSIFVCQVVAIEGDPSWETVTQQMYQDMKLSDKSDELTENRFVDKGSGRIIFSLVEKDNLKLGNPFLPRIYNVFPMVGEWVKVIAYDIAENDINYDYIGPIIPSLTNTNDSTDAIGRRNEETYGNFGKNDTIINFQGTSNNVKKIYPTTTDIAIQGRGSSQILIRKVDTNLQNPNEYVVIRSGMFLKTETNNIPEFNDKESFIKITTEPDPKIGTEYTDTNSNYIKHIFNSKSDSDSIDLPKKSNTIKTRVDIVGEKINLFTYPNTSDTAYSIPYAELWAEYMSILQNWLINHQHGIDGTVAQDPAQKLGENLGITNKGYILLPGKGSKLAITKDIKII